MPRYRRAAFALALLVPIGSGHFYARETEAGIVFLSATLACLLGAMITQSSWPLAAAALIVGVDALSAPAAVTRFNRRAPRSPRAQVASTSLVVGAVLGWTLLLR